MIKKSYHREAKQNIVNKQPLEPTQKQIKRRKTLTAIRIGAPILALVFAIIGVSFSWFNFNKNASVNDFNVTTIEVNNTLVSTDGEEWTDNIVFNEDSDFSFWPVAADGTNFYLQRQYDDDGNRIGEWETLSNGKQVFIPSFNYKSIEDLSSSNALACMDFQLKSESDSVLYLDPASRIVPADVDDFTDYVAGAMRVAMYSIDADKNAQLLFMWVPNTTYQVNLSTDNQTTTTVATDSTVIEAIKLTTNADGSSSEIATNSNPSGYTKINGDSAYLFWGDLADIDAIKTNPIIQTKGDEAQAFRIVIWFEATDRECETFFAGGNIVTELSFTSQLKEGEAK